MNSPVGQKASLPLEFQMPSLVSLARLFFYSFLLKDCTDTFFSDTTCHGNKQVKIALYQKQLNNIQMLVLYGSNFS